jgi:hypothetical protein
VGDIGIKDKLQKFGYMYLCLVIRANPMVVSITLNLTLVVEGSDFLYIFFLELLEIFVAC